MNGHHRHKATVGIIEQALGLTYHATDTAIQLIAVRSWVAPVLYCVLHSFGGNGNNALNVHKVVLTFGSIGGSIGAAPLTFADAMDQVTQVTTNEIVDTNPLPLPSRMTVDTPRIRQQPRRTISSSFLDPNKANPNRHPIIHPTTAPLPVLVRKWGCLSPPDTATIEAQHGKETGNRETAPSQNPKNIRKTVAGTL